MTVVMAIAALVLLLSAGIIIQKAELLKKRK
jgi:archaellin